MGHVDVCVWRYLSLRPEVPHGCRPYHNARARSQIVDVVRKCILVILYTLVELQALPGEVVHKFVAIGIGQPDFLVQANLFFCLPFAYAFECSATVVRLVLDCQCSHHGQ